MTSGNTRISASTADQSQAETFDFLYASGATGSLSEPALNFIGDASFKHSMAQLVITLTADPNGGFSDGVDAVTNHATITLDGIALEGEFDTATGIAAATGSPANLPLSFPYTVSNTTARSSLILFPQAVGEVELNIEYQGATYSCTLTPTLAAGKRYTANVTLRKSGLTVGSSTISDWEQGGSFTGDATLPEPFPSIMVAGHEAVMMRKPYIVSVTGAYIPALYFATCNLGASRPEDAGKYFWFGDVKGYEANRRFYFNKQNTTDIITLADPDDLVSQGILGYREILTSKYDAAQVQWGSGWHMPTLEDLDWLRLPKNCVWEEQEVQTGTDVVKGWLVTSIETNKSIFIPKAGYRFSPDSDKSGPVYDSGTGLYLWSSTAMTHYAYGLINGEMEYWEVYYGMPIRPVYEQ